MALQAPDWFRVITDLIYAGRTMADIARVVDASMSGQLLSHYRSGGQPTYVRGEALVRLWCEVTGKQADAIPRLPFIAPDRSRRSQRVRAGRAPRPSV